VASAVAHHHTFVLVAHHGVPSEGGVARGTGGHDTDGGHHDAGASTAVHPSRRKVDSDIAPRYRSATPEGSDLHGKRLEP
jgi:hypothetical protein